MVEIAYDKYLSLTDPNFVNKDISEVSNICETCNVDKITHLGKSWLISFKLLNRYKKYVVDKGSITINGVSLSIT